MLICFGFCLRLDYFRLGALGSAARIVLLALAFCSAPVRAEQNMALVIGISQYTEINSLRYADADALEFSQILTDFAEYDRASVTLLLNQQATKKRIVDEINRIVRESEKRPLDNFIFMFAGHGMESTITANKRQGGNVRQETNIFLAPADASTDDNNFYSSGAGGEVSNETFINKAWLARQLSAIKAKSIFIILDSCYSGTKSFGTLFTENEGYEIQEFGTGGGKRGVAMTNKRALARMTEQSAREIVSRKVAYLASSRDDQTSAEYDELRHGALSFCIFQYLKEIRRETQVGERYPVSIEEVYANISKLFRETKVNGYALDAAHQPLLIPIPDLANMREMHIFSVPGIKKRPVVVAPIVRPPAQLPAKPPAQLPAQASVQPPVQAPVPLPVQAPPSKFGMLSIETFPSGLQIFVDGEKRNELTSAQLKLPEGRHSVELYMPGTGFRHSFTADIDEYKPLSKSFSLYGQLGISSFWLIKGKKTPGPELDVYIDGKRAGKSNLVLDKLLAGTHEVTVTYMNVTKSRHIEIRPDSPLYINYSVIREAAAPVNDRGVNNVTF